MIQSDTAISVSGLGKSYKNRKVLENIDFTIRKGSIFALLGSNGAGKTTTIKILTTLLKPDKGRAEIYGFDVARQPDRVRKSGRTEFNTFDNNRRQCKTDGIDT